MQKLYALELYLCWLKTVSRPWYLLSQQREYNSYHLNMREVAYKKSNHTVKVELDKYIELEQWKKLMHDIERERHLNEIHLFGELAGLGEFAF